jgi:hypothetical protein
MASLIQPHKQMNGRGANLFPGSGGHRAIQFAATRFTAGVATCQTTTSNRLRYGSIEQLIDLSVRDIAKGGLG